MINQYIIYKFNHEYVDINIEDYYFQNYIQLDFAKFEVRYFDELNNAIWRVVRNYCYKNGFWIDHNFGPNKSCITVILQVIITN